MALVLVVMLMAASWREAGGNSHVGYVDGLSEDIVRAEAQGSNGK